MDDWDYPDFLYAGGGIFNTGELDEAIAQATSTISHSGQFSAEATIRTAIRAQNGSKAVRLMRWTDRPWDDGGDYFPNHAYYSTWVYYPHAYNPNKYDPWDPGDGGWWNTFQFKSDDENGVSQPIWALNTYHDDANGWMVHYLYSKENPPHSYDPLVVRPVPVGRWVHLEAFYRQADDATGHISIWQDGVLILDVPNVVTILSGNAVWGIGNYTDHIAGGPIEGEATLYFDDCVVSTQRISAAMPELFADGFDSGDLRHWQTTN